MSTSYPLDGKQFANDLQIISHTLHIRQAEEVDKVDLLLIIANF